MFYWAFIKVICSLFIPIPIRPRVVAAIHVPNTWICSCDGFTSVFNEAKVFWTSPHIEAILKPDEHPMKRRASLRPRSE